MEPICSEAELQEFHPTRQMLGLAQQLVSQPLLSRVELNCLILEDASFESFDSLALRVGSHYFYQGLHSVYRLAVNRIGSLDELGNLSSAFSGLSGGIQQLYYEPRQGLVTSPRAFARGTLKGVGGLAGGVVGGTGIALFSFASAMGKHAGTLANAISMDSEWKHHRRAQQQRHAQSTRGGLLMGAQSLGQGLLEGGKGVFVKPVAGAMDDGARGFVKGLGTGLTLTPTRIVTLPLTLTLILTLPLILTLTLTLPLPLPLTRSGHRPARPHCQAYLGAGRRHGQDRRGARERRQAPRQRPRAHPAARAPAASHRS